MFLIKVKYGAMPSQIVLGEAAALLTPVLGGLRDLIVALGVGGLFALDLGVLELAVSLTLLLLGFRQAGLGAGEALLFDFEACLLGFFDELLSD